MVGRPSKFPSRFISLACRCLMEGRISRGTFAEYLEIDRAEIDGYLDDAGFVKKTMRKLLLPGADVIIDLHTLGLFEKYVI